MSSRTVQKGAAHHPRWCVLGKGEGKEREAGDFDFDFFWGMEVVTQTETVVLHGCSCRFQLSGDDNPSPRKPQLSDDSKPGEREHG